VEKSAPEEYDKITRKHYQDRSVAKRYWDEYRGQWKLKTCAAHLVARREIRIVNSMLSTIVDRGTPTVRRIVDLPCGTGKLATVFSRFGLSVVAADISCQMMEIAEEEYSKLPSFCGFVQADACATSFGDGEFDAAVCLRLLHRVPDTVRQLILCELNRISRNYVILSAGVVGRVQMVRGRVREFTTGTVTVPYPVTKEQLASQFTKAGLRALHWAPVLPLVSSEWLVICEKESAHT
jgi:ubiquinone/menaquinone biosynthesis C-methylase UbiE